MTKDRTFNTTNRKSERITNKKRKDAERIYKQRNAQKKRKRKLRKYMLYYILLLILTITTGAVLSVTVFFNISKFDVDPTDAYTKEEVITASKVKAGDNLVRLNLGEVEKNILNSLIKLDDVKVTRSFPDALSIKCEKANIEYSCKQADGTYVYLSEKNRVISKGEPQISSGSTVLIGVDLSGSNAGDFVDVNNMSKNTLAELKDKIEQSGLKDVTGIEITGDNSANIVYQNRITIKIDDLKDASYILENSVKILNEYIGAEEQGEIFYQESNNSIHFLPNHS